MLGTKISQSVYSLRKPEKLQARKDTFAKWPHMGYKYAVPDTLAKAGFVFKPEVGRPDKCICLTCGTSLVGWEPDDDPFLEHLKHAPHCAYLEMLMAQNPEVFKSKTEVSFDNQIDAKDLQKIQFSNQMKDFVGNLLVSSLYCDDADAMLTFEDEDKDQ
mmetsp:Transcript_52613/g.60185  ORF Transcript_52613/g.60185 Transcript_52613/m.60185 type:complete len:159 (+) Transcript_52613:80-556(+)